MIAFMYACVCALGLGVGLQVPDFSGRTALHWSMKHSSTRCLDALLKTTSLAVINHAYVCPPDLAL